MVAKLLGEERMGSMEKERGGAGISVRRVRVNLLAACWLVSDGEICGYSGAGVGRDCEDVRRAGSFAPLSFESFVGT